MYSPSSDDSSCLAISFSSPRSPDSVSCSERVASLPFGVCFSSDSELALNPDEGLDKQYVFGKLYLFNDYGCTSIFGYSMFFIFIVLS